MAYYDLNGSDTFINELSKALKKDCGIDLNNVDIWFVQNLNHLVIKTSCL